MKNEKMEGRNVDHFAEFLIYIIMTSLTNKNLTYNETEKRVQSHNLRSSTRLTIRQTKLKSVSTSRDRIMRQQGSNVFRCKPRNQQPFQNGQNPFISTPAYLTVVWNE